MKSEGCNKFFLASKVMAPYHVDLGSLLVPFPELCTDPDSRQGKREEVAVEGRKVAPKFLFLNFEVGCCDGQNIATELSKVT